MKLYSFPRQDSLDLDVKIDLWLYTYDLSSN